MKITEKFIEFLWRSKRFDYRNMSTTDGQKVQILHFGQVNHMAGPDVEMARVLIDDVEWIGSVEFHVLTSDWVAHGHDDNEGFDNVILHLVWKHDKEIEHPTGKKIPTVELHDLVNHSLVKAATNLQEKNSQFIPCENLIHTVDSFYIETYLPRLCIEKLDQKKSNLDQLYSEVGRDLNQLIFVYMTRYYGLTGNQDLFEEIAKRIPYKLLCKHKYNMTQIEAILFGTAKLIEGNSDYALELNREYEYLQSLYDLQPFTKNTIKMTGRPASFPTLRLASLAAALASSNNFVQSLLKVRTYSDVKKLIEVERSPYWSKNYTFSSHNIKDETPKIGKQFVDLLTINAVVPLLYFAGKELQSEELLEAASELLESIPSEKNNIVKKWKNLGVTSRSALESQALLHLHKDYCKQKACLRCSIGYSILS